METRHILTAKIAYLLLLAGLASFCPLPAQAQLADSLARVLRTAPADTNRVILLTDYAWEINEIQTDEADRRLREAIRLAQKLKFLRGEALAWNGLGVVEEIRGNIDGAEKHYQKALELRRKLGDPHEIASSLNNLGVLYELTGRFENAVIFQRENLEIQKALGDTLRIARAQFNLAAAHQEMGMYDEAQQYLDEAQKILERRNDLDGIAKVNAQLGHLYFELEHHAEALKHYAKELEIREKLDDPGRLAEALTDFANALDELDSSETAVQYYIRALRIWEQLDDEPGKLQVYINLGDAYKHIGDYATGLYYLRQAEAICLELDDQYNLLEIYNTMGDTYSRAGQQQKSLEFVNKFYQLAQESKNDRYIVGALKDFAEVYAKMGQYQKAYEYRVQYDELRYKMVNEKLSTDFARRQAVNEQKKREEQIKQQQIDIELERVRTAEFRTRFYAALGGALALGVLITLLYNRNRMRARANRELAAKNAEIEHERQRADELLTNILPAATADELKAHASVKPTRYDSVTVMFTDFERFTTIAETVSFEVLIAELNTCFSLFDKIVEQHNLEKIKTIGDAYMCAGGLPTPTDSHPADIVRAAIEMQRELQALMRQNEAAGKPIFNMRIGIHTGPVVAGVVGSHKFAYDIWGDTVNTAARLEQSSASHKINISETTYQAVQDLFDCQYRGELEAKHKGKIRMYFVEY